MNVIRKIALIALCCLFIPGFSAFAAEKGKIGVVDFQEVIDTSIEGKAVNAELVAFNEKWKSKLMAKRKEIEAVQKKLDDDVMMSREKKEKLTRDRAKLFVDFKSDEKKYKEDINVLRNRKLKLLTDTSVALAKEIGEKEGYSIIIGKAGILYHSDAVDLTGKMIKLYNKQYARKSGSKKKK